MEGTIAPAGEETTLAGVGRSIEDELGEVFDGLHAERKPEIFELPGFRERLQVKYRVLTKDEADEIGEKVAEQVRAGDVDNLPFTILIDGLIASCVGFYTEREVDGEAKVLPLNETLRESDDKLIRWGDPRLLAIFAAKLAEIHDGEDISRLTVRQRIVGIVGDERLVHRHATEVNRWAERELEAVHSDF